MSATNRMADVHWHCSVQRPGLTKLEHVGRRGYPCSNLFAAPRVLVVVFSTVGLGISIA